MLIHYQNNSQVVQGNLNELISKWIMNLPIKQDDTEQEEQHKLLAEFFLNKRELIPNNCYEHLFATLAKIYNTKACTKETNQLIEKIFNENVKADNNLRQIVDALYNNPNTDEIIKNKLKKLIV